MHIFWDCALMCAIISCFKKKWKRCLLLYIIKRYTSLQLQFVYELFYRFRYLTYFISIKFVLIYCQKQYGKHVIILFKVTSMIYENWAKITSKSQQTFRIVMLRRSRWAKIYLMSKRYVLDEQTRPVSHRPG